MDMTTRVTPAHLTKPGLLLLTFETSCQPDISLVSPGEIAIRLVKDIHKCKWLVVYLGLPRKGSSSKMRAMLPENRSNLLVGGQ